MITGVSIDAVRARMSRGNVENPDGVRFPKGLRAKPGNSNATLPRGDDVSRASSYGHGSKACWSECSIAKKIEPSGLVSR